MREPIRTFVGEHIIHITRTNTVVTYTGTSFGSRMV